MDKENGEVCQHLYNKVLDSIPKTLLFFDFVLLFFWLCGGEVGVIFASELCLDKGVK